MYGVKVHLVKKMSLFQEKLKFSMECTEWASHAVESRVFSANNLLNLSTLHLTGIRGPLIENHPENKLSCLLSKPAKSCFRQYSMQNNTFKLRFAATVPVVLPVMSMPV